jgi:hypothetical protein
MRYFLEDIHLTERPNHPAAGRGRNRVFVENWIPLPGLPDQHRSGDHICGNEHDGLPDVGADRPDPFWMIPEDERDRRRRIEAPHRG